MIHRQWSHERPLFSNEEIGNCLLSDPAEGKTICKHKTGNSIQLTFSQCYPGKFTCDSGQCVPLEERCNIEMNCEDQKDEYNCAGIKIGNEYASEKMI